MQVVQHGDEAGAHAEAGSALPRKAQTIPPGRLTLSHTCVPVFTWHFVWHAEDEATQTLRLPF